MMEIWSILLTFLIIFTLLASIRLGFAGFLTFPSSKIFKFITAPAWCCLLFLFLPWQMGEFARAENSPFPWEAFMQANLRHGFLEGIISATIVLLVDLWLFWIPAHIWLNKHSDSDATKRIMARIINFLIGLILTQVANPIYRLLS